MFDFKLNNYQWLPAILNFKWVSILIINYNTWKRKSGQLLLFIFHSILETNSYHYPQTALNIAVFELMWESWHRVVYLWFTTYRQRAVTAHLHSNQLLLFVIVWQCDQLTHPASGGYRVPV